jgi:two-component system sensor histidine kinase YesM
MGKIRRNSVKKHNSKATDFSPIFMQKKYFFRNFFLFIIPTLVPILLLGIFTIILSNNFNKDSFKKNNTALLKQMETNIDLIMNELDALNMSFNYNIDISLQIKNLLESSSSTYEEYRISQLIKNFVSSPANAKPFVHCIYVYYNNKKGRFISSTNGVNSLNLFADTAWFETFSRNDIDTDLYSEIRYISHYEYQAQIPVLTIYKRIYSPGVYNANGVIVLNIYLNYLEKMLQDHITFKNQSLFVIDENDRFLFGNKQSSSLGEEVLTAINKTNDPYFLYRSETDRYNVFKLRSEKYGWTYVSVVPESSFNQLPTQLRILTVLLLALSLILAIVPAYYLTRRNQSNINRIISIIDSAEKQRPLPPLPDVVKDEYSYIIHNIMNTFMERSYLKLQLSERKYKLQAAELLSLQSQINPHFLHNTLETIYWEILRVSGKPTVAHKMIENLSDIMKYSLSSKDNFVTIGEEIENTKSYIDIQKYRYEDKFDVYWDYSPLVNDYKVKKLIFQPLVENSIYHGIIRKDTCCYIKIKIVKSASHLRIFVADNGAGIPPHRLNEIKQKLESNDDLSEHIGLFNTNKRLKLVYGEEYGIRIRSLPDKGTVVFLYIPILI